MCLLHGMLRRGLRLYTGSVSTASTHRLRPRTSIDSPRAAARTSNSHRPCRLGPKELRRSGLRRRGSAALAGALRRVVPLRSCGLFGPGNRAIVRRGLPFTASRSAVTASATRASPWLATIACVIICSPRRASRESTRSQPPLRAVARGEQVRSGCHTTNGRAARRHTEGRVRRVRPSERRRRRRRRRQHDRAGRAARQGRHAAE